MANFPIPPTYAPPIEEDPTTRRPVFAPVWLRWFLDVAQYFASIGLGGSGIQHNALGGLQGGGANEYYHFTNSDYTALSGTRITKGTLTTDDLIVDLDTTGLVLKDNAGTPHYWRVTVNTAGSLVVTDLGTSPP